MKNIIIYSIVFLGFLIYNFRLSKNLNLQNIINKNKKIESNIGIGHTRWATHGAPSDINAHPHSRVPKYP